MDRPGISILKSIKIFCFLEQLIGKIVVYNEFKNMVIRQLHPNIIREKIFSNKFTKVNIISDRIKFFFHKCELLLNLYFRIVS
jgi:hypothetical protein